MTAPNQTPAPPIVIPHIEITKEVEKALLKRISEARLAVTMALPFFGYLCSRLRPKVSNEVPTAGITPGGDLYMNPGFCSLLSQNEMAGLLCFPPGEMVSGSYKPIEAMAVGDTVFDSEGGRGTVVRTFERQHVGSMFCIRGINLLSFRCTDEHPIYVVRTERQKGVQRENRSLAERVGSAQPQWVQAKDLKEKLDFLVIPRVKGTVGETHFDLSQYMHPSRVEPTRQVLRDFPLNEDTAWMLGLYAAEGSRVASRNKQGELTWESGERVVSGCQFTLGTKDKTSGTVARLVQIVRDTFDRPTTISEIEERSTIQAVVSSRTLASFLTEHIGHGSKEKRVPDFILNHKDLGIVSAFIRGYLAGDGCVVERERRVVQAGTTSKTLALQLQMLFARLGVLVNLYLYHRPAGYHTIREHVLPEYNIYQLALQGNTEVVGIENRQAARARASYLVQDDMILVPIVEISKEMYSGPVYNIETTDHTYTVNNAAVHNCHEVMHPAMGFWRRFPKLGGRGYVNVDEKGRTSLSLANIAHDFAINLLITDMANTTVRSRQYIQLPKGGLLDEKYRGMSAEQIYDILKKEVVAKGTYKIWGAESGDVMEGDDPRDGMSDEQLREWQLSVVAAAQLHKKKGTLPGSLQKIIDEILEPRVPWTDILRQWVGENAIVSDYSYSRPSRRSESVGEFLPTMIRTGGVDQLAVLWDTSGSMNGEEKWIFAELEVLADELGLTLRVIMCDTQVHADVKDVRRAEQVADEIKGGGGSDFTPAFDLLDEEFYGGVVVAFTDGYISVPSSKPTYLRDCLWVLTEHGADPTRGAWGQVLRVFEDSSGKLG